METGMNDLLNVKEAAIQCGRNMETVRRWIWGGKLPARKLGNQLFIRKNDLAVFCREAAIAYRTETDFPEKSSVTEPLDAGDLIRRMRDERINLLTEYSYGQTSSPVPGGRANLIKRMKKLRQSIRSRVGNLDAAETIEILRKERGDELTGLC